jgi:hypothetical protein
MDVVAYANACFSHASVDSALAAARPEGAALALDAQLQNAHDNIAAELARSTRFAQDAQARVVSIAYTSAVPDLRPGMLGFFNVGVLVTYALGTTDDDHLWLDIDGPIVELRLINAAGAPVPGVLVLKKHDLQLGIHEVPAGVIDGAQLAHALRDDMDVLCDWRAAEHKAFESLALNEDFSVATGGRIENLGAARVGDVVGVQIKTLCDLRVFVDENGAASWSDIWNA